MKRLLSPALLLLLSTSAALAQGATIHATMTKHGDGTTSSTVVDSEKRTAEERLEDSKGKLLRLITYLMDDRDQYMGSITSDPQGNVLYRTSFKRDFSGRIDEEVVTDANGKLIRRRVYTFGSGNKVTQITEYDANGNGITTTRHDSNAATAAGAQPQGLKKGRK